MGHRVPRATHVRHATTVDEPDHHALGAGNQPQRPIRDPLHQPHRVELLAQRSSEIAAAHRLSPAVGGRTQRPTPATGSINAYRSETHRLEQVPVHPGGTRETAPLHPGAASRSTYPIALGDSLDAAKICVGLTCRGASPVADGGLNYPECGQARLAPPVGRARSETAPTPTGGRLAFYAPGCVRRWPC